MAALGEYWIAGVEDLARVDDLLKLGAEPDAPDPFGRLPIETTRSRTVAAHLVRVGASVTEAAVETAAHTAHLPQRYTGLLRALRGDGPPTRDDIVDTVHTFVFCESSESIWTVCFGGVLAKWTLENGQLSLHSWHDKGWD